MPLAEDKVEAMIEAAVDRVAAELRLELRAVAAARATVGPEGPGVGSEPPGQFVTDVRAEEREADLAASDRLVAASRAIAQATSLSGLLDALAAAAQAEASRSAVLLVEGDRLRAWSLAGFPDSAADVTAWPIEAGSMLADAIRANETRSTSGGEGSGALPAPFTLPAANRAALAVPIAVGGHVVALAYGDDARGDEPVVPSAWPERLELVARQAGLAAEALMVRQAARLLRAPGSLAESVVTRADRAAAQRYARLLVSEIRLYQEAAVEEGRRAGDLGRRLQGPIDRARQLYEERVPLLVRQQSQYFDQELVRTLADGDPSLLG